MANLDPSREFRLIETIRPLCGDSSDRWEKGIGDDCAVRKVSADPLLLTADTMVENVHFRLDLMSLREVGFKAIAGSVSDVYAMGGTAESIAINLIFPKTEQAEELIEELYRGIHEAVTLFGTPIIGGDMTSGPCWIIAVTVLGDAGSTILYRSGAKPGDSIWVTGTPGLSGLGLDLLLSGGRTSAEYIDSEAVRAHIRPVPRFGSVTWIQQNPQITSMIDISDGVGKELLTIAAESRVGATITLPDSLCVRLDQNRDTTTGIRRAHELFLGGGEDYELLFTASPDFIPRLNGVKCTRIGTITQNENSYFTDADGRSVPLSGGWDHL